MADVTDGSWGEPEYKLNFEFKYDGIYSKYVDEIYFRGENHIITQYGFLVKNNHGRYPNYSFYQTLEKYCSPENINLINIDKLIRRDLLRVSDIAVSENEIILCEREAKMKKLKKQIKKEKSIPYKVRKLFKRI